MVHILFFAIILLSSLPTLASITNEADSITAEQQYINSVFSTYNVGTPRDLILYYYRPGNCIKCVVAVEQRLLKHATTWEKYLVYPCSRQKEFTLFKKKYNTNEYEQDITIDSMIADYGVRYKNINIPSDTILLVIYAKGTHYITLSYADTIDAKKMAEVEKLITK